MTPSANKRLDVDVRPFRHAREAILNEVDEWLTDRRRGGLALTDMLSRRFDSVVGDCLKLVVEHSEPPPCRVYATGGFGRRWLAPRSDIDLLVVHELALSDERSSQALAAFTGRFQTLLRDVGFRVGIAVRSTSQCRELATQDLTIGSSMLSARPLWDGGLDRLPWGPADQLDSWVAGLLRAEDGGVGFAAAVRQGCAARHERHGRTVYRLEPNVKEGRGGVRDISALLWSARVLHDAVDLNAVGDVAGVGRSDLDRFREAVEVVFRVRVALHRAAGRHGNDRLTFALQEQVAPLFIGGETSQGPLPVERFMQLFYRSCSTISTDALAWQDVWLLPRDDADPVFLRPGLCVRQGHLDFGRGEDQPSPEAVVAGVALGPEPPVAPDASGVIPVAPTQDELGDNALALLADNPLELLEAALELGLPVHPVARVKLRRAARALAKRDLAELCRLQASTRRLLTIPGCPWELLELLGTSEVMTVVIPEWRPIRALATHDVYHTYTVDAHLLRALREMTGILGGAESCQPYEELFYAIGRSVPPQRHAVLMLAALLHDIGKGRGGDHSIIGAELVRDIGSRLGLTTYQIDHLSWLVREHLLLPRISQRRDLSDNRTIEQVALSVRTVPALEDLVLLTVADMRAVRDGNFTAWTGGLLAELFVAVRELLTGGLDQRPTPGPQARAATAEALEDEADAELVARFVAEMPPAYVEATSPEAVARHFRIWSERRAVAIGFHTPAEADYTEVVLSADDRPGMLATITGVMAATDINILSAEVVTGTSGRVLDVFSVQSRTQRPVDQPRKRKKLEDRLTRALDGDLSVEDLLEARRRQGLGTRAVPDVPTEISWERADDTSPVIFEVKTRDRLGLLYRITRTLFTMGCDIVFSRVVTQGARIIDVFYLEPMSEEDPLTDGKLQGVVAELITAIEALDQEGA